MSSSQTATTPSLQTLRIARCGSRALGPLAARVVGFIRSRQCADGGFMGRAGGSDLYYAAFAVELLCALDAPFPEGLVDYLAGFGTGEGLDFMHAASLARCRARVPASRPSSEIDAGALVAAILRTRSADGGFHTVAGQSHASATGIFMAVHALHDLGATAWIDAPVLIRALDGLRTADGGYGNDPGMRHGTTLAAAGVVTLRAWLGAPPEPAVAQWLCTQMHPEGGFCASPEIAMPDLLTTATVLYALWLAGEELESLYGPCERFVDGLMNDDGGYTGHWCDDTADLEYTYYGLVSLGALLSGQHLPGGGVACP